LREHRSERFFSSVIGQIPYVELACHRASLTRRTDTGLVSLEGSHRGAAASHENRS
jgi:hypothetical protein